MTCMYIGDKVDGNLVRFFLAHLDGGRVEASQHLTIVPRGDEGELMLGLGIGDDFPQKLSVVLSKPPQKTKIVSPSDSNWRIRSEMTRAKA